MPILRRGAGAAAAAARIVSAVPSGVGRAAPAPAPAPVSNRGAAVQRVVQQAPAATNRGAAVQRVAQQIVQQAVQRNAYQPRGMTSGGAVVTALPRTGVGRSYAGSGAMGFPMGTAYPDVQPQFLDSETANLIHMLVQRANPRLPAPTSDPLLRYAGYTAIRDTFPLTPDTPMSNEEMIALLRLADQQDFQYRVPPGSVPDPPEMQAARARQDEVGDAFDRIQQTMRRSRRPRSSGVIGDGTSVEGADYYDPTLPPIYNLDQDDLTPEQRMTEEQRRARAARFGRITQGMSDTQQMFDQPNMRSERAQAILDRITPEMAQTERLLGESNRGELERIGREREAQRVTNIEREIRSIEARLASDAGTMPVDERVDLQQRLEELRRIRDGIYEENKGTQPTVFEQAWTNVSNIGLEDVDDIIRSIGGIGIPGTDSTIGSATTRNPVTQRIIDRVQQLADSPEARTVGRAFQDAMEWYSDEIQTPIKRSTAELIYQYALSDPEQSELDLNDFGSGFSFLFALPVMAAIEFDDTFGDGSTRQNIIEAYEAGGADPTWEVIIGLADGMPWPIKYAWIAAGETLTDPAIAAGFVSRGGAALRGVGRAFSAIPEATIAEQVAGATLRGTGTVVQHMGTFLDSLFLEPIARGVGRGGRRMFGSLLDESIATAEREADRTLTGAGARAEEAIRRAGDRPPAGAAPATGPAASPPGRTPSPGHAPTGGVTWFRTAKGSTYTVTPNGTTIRDKAPRPEHPGQQGIQPESETTIYVRPEHIDRLADIQLRGSGTRRIVFDGPHDRVAVFHDNPGQGVRGITKDSITPFSRNPQVGWHPVEIWGDGRKVHFGNEITDVKAGNPPATATGNGPPSSAARSTESILDDGVDTNGAPLTRSRPPAAATTADELADAVDDAADVARDTPSATAAADDGDLSVDALREESASGGFVTRSGHVADDGADAPPVASTVDEAAVITADADGVITVSARGIPSTLPNLRRAAQRLARVADSPAARTGMRQTGDDLLTPTFGGTRVQDEVFTAGVRAVDAGDLEAARVLDAELEDLEVRAIEAGLGSESTFLRFNEGGAHINTSAVPLSDAELLMFRGAAGASSDTAARSAANRARNGAVKGAYELAHKLRFDAQNRVNVHRRLFGDRPLPTTANPAFRTATDASFTDERLYWLMEEDVVTPDGARAQAIKDVLNRVDDQGYFREGPNGPYLTAIPPDIKRPGSSLTMREEIDTLLSLARKEYHEAIARPPRADDATRIGGGLKAESKAAADKIRKAEAEEARVTANAALKNTAEVKELEERLLELAQKNTPEARAEVDLLDDVSRPPIESDGEIVVRSSPGTASVSRGTDYENGYTIYKREGSSQGNNWIVEGPDGTTVGRATKKDAIAEARRRLGAVGDEIMGRNLGFIPEPIRRGLNLLDRYNAGRWATVTEADTGMAAGVRDPNLRWANESGELDVETTLFLDQEIDWVPPFDPIPGRITKLDWADGGQLALDPSMGTQKYSVWDAINWHKDQQAKNPDKMLNGKPYDYDAAYQRISELAVGFRYDVKGRAIGIKDKDFGATAQLIDRIGKTRMLRWYDTAMNVIQRQHRRYGPLRGVRNFVGDSVGTAWQLGVMGEFNAMAHMNPITLAIDTHAYRGMKRDLSRIAESIDHPFLAGTGQMLPNKLWPGVSRGEDVFAGLPDLNRVLAPYGPARHLANIWSLPVFKDALTQIDITSRKTMWIDNYEHIARREGMPAFIKTLNRLAGDEITAAEWVRRINAEAARHTPVYEGAFSPGDIRKALDGVTNQNTALARAWQSELTKASDKAVKRTEDVLFTYRNTNADEIARRIFVFHYWQTRAIPLHLRATLRNPILLSSYYKMWEAMDRIAEEQNLGPYLQGMMPFYTSPGGIDAMFNPIGLLLPTTIFDAYDEKGQRASVLINQMAPPVAAWLAVLGMHDQAPDMLATYHDENFVRRLGNYLKGQGYDLSQIPVLGQVLDPSTMALTNPTEELWKTLIEGANTALGRLGLNVGEFTPFNRGANELDQLRTWVQQAANEAFGPRYDLDGNDLWTPEQVAMYTEAMEGVRTGVMGNPLSDAARESYGNEEGLTAAFSVVVPAGAAVSSSFRRDIIARADEFRDQGFKGTPEQRGAHDFRQEASASDPTWQIASTQFHNLGTEEARLLWGIYNDILLDPERAVLLQYWVTLPNGETDWIKPPPGLAQMSYEDRKAWADQWLAGQPNGPALLDQYRAERDAFMAANPEYQDFKTYQGGVYDQEEKPGGIKAWREELAKTNPNFKHEMNERREWLKDQGYTGTVLEAELDQWATTEAGFLAAMGRQDSLYDDAPRDVYDSSQDPLANPNLGSIMAPPEESGGEGGASGSGSSGGSRGDRAFRGPSRHPVEGSIRYYEEKLAEDLAEYEADNALQERKYGDAWDSEKGQWEKWAYDLDYKSDTYPTKTNLMKEYETFVQRGGVNGDTSQEAFIAWLAENYTAVQGGSSRGGGGTSSGQMLRAEDGSMVPASFYGRGTRGNGFTPQSGAGSDYLGTAFGGDANISFAFGAPNDLGYYGYSTQYGMNGSDHTGIDIPQPHGSPIYAPADAVVYCVGCFRNEQDQATGQIGRIELEMPDGAHVLFDHSLAATVNEGDVVRAGEQIGTNGQMDDFPHTHLEVRIPDPSMPSGWRLVDPVTYFQQYP
jgi:murein DD-endopeptidase MepM/ murein hydrolase activator NlpD